MTATERLQAYLGPALLSIPGIVYVQNSDGESIDRFTSDSVSEDVYPGVFYIASDYDIINNGFGDIRAEFPLSLYFLNHLDNQSYKDDNDRWQMEEDAFKAAELNVIEAYKKFKHDDLNTLLTVYFSGKNWKAERIKDVTADLAFGYLVTTKISIPVHDIYC